MSNEITMTWASFQPALPEIYLTAAICVLLMADVFFGHTHKRFTPTLTLILLAGAFGLFLWEQQVNGATIEQARTLVVNTIVMVEAFYLLNCRSLTRSVKSLGWFSNKWLLGGIGAMVLAQVAFTHLPVMNKLFQTSPLGADEWIRVVGVGLAAFWIVGFEKWVRFRMSKTGDPVIT